MRIYCKEKNGVYRSREKISVSAYIIVNTSVSDMKKYIHTHT